MLDRYDSDHRVDVVDDVAGMRNWNIHARKRAKANPVVTIDIHPCTIEYYSDNHVRCIVKLTPMLML